MTSGSHCAMQKILHVNSITSAVIRGPLFHGTPENSEWTVMMLTTIVSPYKHHWAIYKVTLAYFVANNEADKPPFIQVSLQGLFRPVSSHEWEGGLVCVVFQPHPCHCGLKPWQPTVEPFFVINTSGNSQSSSCRASRPFYAPWHWILFCRRNVQQHTQLQ